MQASERLPITVCIPVMNEEKNLPDCLKSLYDAFAEVLVIDSNSTDKTKEIAKNAGAKILNFSWNGKYPKKRNWALETYSFKTEWVFFLDADERVTSDFINELRSRIHGTPHAGFWVSFDNWFMGKPLRYGDRFRKLSIFRRDSGEYEKLEDAFIESLEKTNMDIEVHEHPTLVGTTDKIEARLQHHEYRGLKHYIAKHNEYSSWEAERFLWIKSASPESLKSLNKRQRFKYKYCDRWWLGPFYFIVAYFMKMGIFDGKVGFLFCKLKCRYFSDIRLKILEKQDL